MGTYLQDLGFKNFSIFNRTLSHAVVLAEKLNGDSYSLSDLQNYSKGFDVIVTSTSATKEIISEQIYSKLIGDDKKEKVIIDLAIPADVHPDIVNNNPVKYISIGDLRSEAQKNINSRKAEIYKAKKLVHEFVKEFQRVYLERMVEKAHSIIPIKLNEIKTKAIEEVYRKDFEKLDGQSQETLLKIISYIEKKYIALTMSSSKEAFRKHH